MTNTYRRVYYQNTFLAEGHGSDAELIASAIAEAEVAGIIYPPGSDVVGPTLSQLTAGLKIMACAPEDRPW